MGSCGAAQSQKDYKRSNDYIYDTFHYFSLFGFGIISNGWKDSFFSWKPNWGVLYVAAWRVHDSRKRASSLQTLMQPLWAETSPIFGIRNSTLSCSHMTSLEVRQILVSIKKETNSNSIILVLNVDDMLIVWKHETTLQELKCKLKSAFSMKNLGNTEHILEIRIRWDRQSKLQFVSPEKNIEKVLEIFQMIDTKPSSVPLQSQEKLSKAHYPKDKEETEKKKMQDAATCGSFMYYTTWYCICTRSRKHY